MNKKTFKMSSMLICLISLFVGKIATGAPITEVFLKSRPEAIPKFKSKVNPTDFHDIAIDGSNGNISLAGENAWCEIPFRNNKLYQKGAFIAPTKGFNLTAVAYLKNGICVYNSLDNSVISGNQKFMLSAKLSNVTGLAFLKGNFYLLETGKKELIVGKADKGILKIVKRIKLPVALKGLASNGNILYGCTSQLIFRFNNSFSFDRRYRWKSLLKINGFAVLGDDSFIAVASKKKIIYIMETK